MKKLIALSLILCTVLAFAGCKSDKQLDPIDVNLTDPVVSTSVTKPDESTEPETIITEPQMTTEDETQQTQTSSDWVNYDKVQFMLNGKVCTLGETTLQDLIDMGAPFDEESLVTANNTVPVNSRSTDYYLELGDWSGALIFVFNDTGEAKPASELYISEIYLSLDADEEQDILTFAFPLDMTEEELVAHAGEPTDYFHYDGEGGYYSDDYEYSQSRPSEYGYVAYCFDFVNDVLDTVSLEFIP